MHSGQSAQNARSQIKAELVAHLYKNAPLSLGVSLINGSILAFLQRTVIPGPAILVWFFSLLFITLARTILAYTYHRKKFPHLNTAFWNKAYLLGTGLSGCMWGSAALLLFPPDNLEHQLFVVFVLAGMTAASVPVLASSLKAFALFALPILLSLSLQIYWLGKSLSTPMALLVLLYLIGLTLSAREIHRTIVNSLRLRFDNRMLANEIDERQRAEEALYQQKERLQITFSAMAEGVIITNASGMIEYINPAAESISGWLQPDAVGQPVDEIFAYMDQATGQRHQPAAINTCLEKAASSKKISLLHAKNADRRIIEEIATPLKDSTGKIVGAVAIIRDISQASEHSRQMTYQASHDALTDLPNRTLLSDRLEHAILKAIQTDCLVAVLFMDLDRFKQVNDSFGHVYGDELLCNVAKRIRASVRHEDTVARMGGDEFVVLLEDVTYQLQATRVAQKIVNNLAKPMSVQGQEISVSVSIGIAMFPRHGKDVETLLKHADIAMYRTKALGQEDIQFYTADMNAQAVERLKMEQQLQHAVSRNELELYYQPRVNIEKNKILGFEALVRWRTEPDTLVPPDSFIPIAEETGTIIKIGEWVLQQACQQVRFWHENGHPDLCMAVNLSARQIQNANIVELIAKILKQTQLEPEFLELEITESLFLQDADNAIFTLQNLKALGVKLAIDDFGTGYSSLSYIKRFPIDILKIDRSFIYDISIDPVNGDIVPTIIAMAQRLNLEVIAEGVENKIQRNYLRDLGCIGYQGFLFSKPLPEPEVTRLLHDNTPIWENA